MDKPILYLNVKKKWFDMIKSGEKKEEYRNATLYWRNRLYKYYKIKDFTICFSNGYAKKRNQFLIKCNKIISGYGKKEWGASGEQQFILSLGNIFIKEN